MRRVVLGGTGIETSALGFGCASLGSRVEVREGARALAAAHVIAAWSVQRVWWLADELVR